MSANELPPLPSHPEHGWVWTESELMAILAYGEQCAAVERERCAKLCLEKPGYFGSFANAELFAALIRATD